MLDENDTALTQTQWDAIVHIWEEYQINCNLDIQTSNIKSQAINFLTKKNKRLTRSDLRRFKAKINKIKNSYNRYNKIAEDKLLKELQKILDE
jgi:TRAP-type C4-dicarboxylate transport system substrate-binding protein